MGTSKKAGDPLSNPLETRRRKPSTTRKTSTNGGDFGTVAKTNDGVGETFSTAPISAPATILTDIIPIQSILSPILALTDPDEGERRELEAPKARGTETPPVLLSQEQIEINNTIDKLLDVVANDKLDDEARENQMKPLVKGLMRLSGGKQDKISTEILDKLTAKARERHIDSLNLPEEVRAQFGRDMTELEKLYQERQKLRAQNGQPRLEIDTDADTETQEKQKKAVEARAEKLFEEYNKAYKEGPTYMRDPATKKLFERSAKSKNPFKQHSIGIQAASNALAHLSKLKAWNLQYSLFIGSDKGESFSTELAENADALTTARNNGQSLVLEHNIDGVPKELLRTIAAHQGLDIGNISGLTKGKTIGQLVEAGELTQDQANNIKTATELGHSAINTSQDEILNKMLLMYEIMKLHEELLKFWTAKLAADLKAMHASISLAKSLS